MIIIMNKQHKYLLDESQNPPSLCNWKPFLLIGNGYKV